MKKHPPDLHPFFIEKNGKKESAVIPISEYESLVEYLEEVDDIFDYALRRNEEEINIEEALEDE
ncbi:MAG: type II toxin-antitoxin system Phd/YefM family antitoxin [Spirochaetes bacterium]|nr:type II toxin-antitoxin system Phd/YefM family antitoxin [Spirochaetota bacterium]